MCFFFVSQVNFSSSLDSGSGSGSGSGGTFASAAGCQSPLPLVTLSPIIHPRIREFRSGLGSARKGGPPSAPVEPRFWCRPNGSSPFPDVPPSPLSVHDRYSSPAAGSAKRRLFGEEGATPGLTLISPAKRLMIGPSSALKMGAPGSPAALAVPLQGRGRCGGAWVFFSNAGLPFRFF